MSSRSEKWHATRRVREAALFADRRFEVVREVKGEEFTTPLGYKGRNGYEVRNIDTDETFKVGKATLKRMAEEYEAVALPAPKKRGRPRKAQGGLIEGPGTASSDEIPFHVDNSFVVKQENANEPGAHPVSEPNEDDDRSGTLAGPTYTNSNADIHYTP